MSKRRKGLKNKHNRLRWKGVKWESTYFSKRRRGFAAAAAAAVSAGALCQQAAIRASFGDKSAKMIAITTLLEYAHNESKSAFNKVMYGERGHKLRGAQYCERSEG